MVSYSDFIKTLALIYKPNTYVELGLYNGETLEKVIPYATNIVGVDLNSNTELDNLKIKYPHINLFFNSTDNFFGRVKQGIDMVFINLESSFENIINNFQNILEQLNPGGLIVLHNTDPDPEITSYSGDSYKIVEFLESRNDINIITLALDISGISIVTKKNNTRTQLRNSTQ